MVLVFLFNVYKIINRSMQITINSSVKLIRSKDLKLRKKNIWGYVSYKEKNLKQNQWPSRLSLVDGKIVDSIDEMETYLSSSNLSLATFASLLIKFVWLIILKNWIKRQSPSEMHFAWNNNDHLIMNFNWSIDVLSNFLLLSPNYISDS